MIRAGLIGCGSITEFRHAPEYTANPDSEAAGFFDTRKERAQKLAKIYGGKVYGTMEEMLEDSSIDAVSVCTSNRYHAPVTVKALEAGKHVLCEKPMATTVKDARKMIDTARKTGKYLMIGHNQRLAPAHARAGKILKSGEMGRILTFRTTFGHGGPETWSADKGAHTWFFKKKDAFVGAMGDLGVHKADLIRWLIGDEIDEVCAYVKTLDKKDQDGNMIEVDDNAVCLLKSRSGITGTLTASWTYYGAEDNSTVVYCTNGIVKVYDNPQFPVEVTFKNREKVFYRTGGIQTNENQKSSGVIDMFVNSIKTGTKPPVSGEEGLAALKIILACMESAEKGKSVGV